MSEPRWWTRLNGRSAGRAPQVGALVLALSLVGVTGVVWASPRPSTTVSDPMSSQEKALLAENKALRNSLDAREAEITNLTSSQAKAAAERAAAAEREKARKTAQQAEEASQAQAEAAARSRSSADAAAQRSAAKAASERAIAAARGRGDDLAAQLANARAQAAAAQAAAQSPVVPSAPAAPTPAPVPSAPSLASLLTPTQRAFGLYTAQAPFNWAELDDVTSKVGTPATMVGYFQGWDGPFRPDAVTRSWSKGLLPVMTWESQPLLAGNDQPEDPDYSLPKIIDGDYDAYLHQYAKDIAALGLPVAIRLDHEMNSSWYPWAEHALDGSALNGNNPGDYVRMWRHVHDIFAAEGANAYVLWIWAPNIINNLPSWGARDYAYLASLYPGDDYVDWVGLSGYYRPPYKTGQTPTFDYTFGPSLAQLRRLTDKPILLAEIGASEIGNNKPAWVSDLFDALTRPENDDIIGIAWFNQAVTTISQGQRVTNDWRITSRADSLAAFSTGIANPAAGFVGTLAERDLARAAAASPPAPTSTPTPVPTSTPTASPTPVPTDTSTPSPVPTPSGSATATAEPSEEPSSSPVPTGSPSPSVTG